MSRAPVADPTASDERGEDPIAGLAICACIRAARSDADSAATGPSLVIQYHDLLEAARSDHTYQALVSLVRDGFPQLYSDLSPALTPYWNGRETLSLDNGLVLRGSRIVIPQALRQRVLADLHSSYQGIERTKRRARQTVYWPNLSQDISTIVSECPACREYKPSQPKELLLRDSFPEFPFEFASADMFSCQGWEFLVFSDRLSGWPCVARIGRSASSCDVIHQLRRWFSDVGVPSVLLTDGGPQLSSLQFASFCRTWGIDHRKSSPHYPQSNGHAELSVKAVKHLIYKTTKNGDLDIDEFQRGLLEWRNTPRTGVVSCVNMSLPAATAHHRHPSLKMPMKLAVHVLVAVVVAALNPSV